MFIHLADGSKGRGQYSLLVEETYSNSLFSYAYKEALPHYEVYWNRLLTKGVRPRVIIDSGAFTAWRGGKPINIKDYATWALAIKNQWSSKMESLIFMNLDVIGDQPKSTVNQKTLENVGLNPIPIFTYGADLNILKALLKDYDYLSLGGLVHRKGIQPWLDKCFSVIMENFKETGFLKRIHLLGVCNEKLLLRYPCYSSDSSSWVRALVFGAGDALGLKKNRLPRYSKSKAAFSAHLQALRLDIKRYKTMQDTATKLWESRGVVWE
jgi:hypothetical protein